MELIDFTNCQIDIAHTYLGANGKKIAVNYNNSVYMLKFPSRKKGSDYDYSNSVLSEYISCNIFKLLGFNTQDTILGTYRVGDKVKLVCACKDFTDDNHILQEFASIKNTIIDSPLDGYGIKLDEVLDTIEKQTRIDVNELKAFFWDMFIVDSLLGNFDRHNGNWGLMYNKIDNKTYIAPIYDCGSCLFPQADDEKIKEIMSSQEELESRVYAFPNSALKIDGIKINPYMFITSHSNKDCDEALKRIFPKIDLYIINDFIDTVPSISDIRKDFYKKIIELRYNLILAAAFENMN